MHVKWRKNWTVEIGQKKKLKFSFTPEEGAVYRYQPKVRAVCSKPNQGPKIALLR